MSESAWKARLEEKVVQECSGRGKVGIWVPGERPGRGPGGARISYFGGHPCSGRVFPATASRVSSKQGNKETDSHSLVTACKAGVGGFNRDPISNI